MPNNPDLSSSQFSVDNPSVPSTPVPGPMPLDTNALSNAGLAITTARGDNAIAQTAGSKKSGGGGGILGDIIGIGSKILPFFLSAGGLVGDKTNGFAEGGYNDNQQNTSPGSFIEPPGKQGEGLDPHLALSLGYLTGALHQEKYGGTPDTLHKAADEIKQHLMRQGYGENASSDPWVQQMHTKYPTESNKINSGMAAGGEVNNDIKLAQEAVMRANGIGPSTPSMDQAPQQASTTQVSAPTATAIQGQIQPPVLPKQPQGYVQKFAAGGPEQPPLQPGQAFQGDGSVKGPGGPQDDAIPARLSDGEFVFAAPAVQFYGVDKLVKMNEQGKQGFMQAMHQVDANQPQSPQTAQMPPGAPQAQAAPQGPGMMQPPPQQAPMASGGPTKPSLTMRKNSGYMGM